MSNKARCPWLGKDPIYIDYHDKEWGVPLYDERKMFEFLVLEGMQAGLSWITVLKKRENYRKAFYNFDAEKIARIPPKEVELLLKNEGIIRNRLKIESTITNAQAYLELKKDFHSLVEYFWQFVDGEPIKNNWQTLKDYPTQTELSDIISKDLKSRGFRFIGSTIIYAHLQAAGLINDHTVDCFRHNQV